MKIISYALRIFVVAISIPTPVNALAEQRNDQIDQYSVDAVYGNARVLFSRLDVVSDDQGLFIEGKIRRRSANTPVLSGHVDVLVTAANGDVLLDTTAQYTPSILLRHTNSISQRGSRFKVKLPESMPKDADIKVAYHRNVFQENASSAPALHQKNSLI
jgi:hypothetical protein